MEMNDFKQTVMKNQLVDVLFLVYMYAEFCLMCCVTMERS